MAKKASSKAKIESNNPVKRPGFKLKLPSIMSIIRVLRDERSHFIFGLISLFFAAFLTVAFVSYLFTWKHDQDIVDRGLFKMIIFPDKVENLGSKLGAALSNLFIHNWFGIASFAFIFLLLLSGFRMMKIRILPFGKSLKFTILGIIWTSITLGFLFGRKYFFMGGAHGVIMSEWLNSVISKFGTVFLILLSLFAFIIFTVENALEWSKKFFQDLLNGNIKGKNIHWKFWEQTNQQIISNVQNQSIPDQNLSENKNIQNANIQNAKVQNVKKPIGKEVELPVKTIVKKEFLLHDDGKEEDPNAIKMEVDNTVKRNEEENYIPEKENNLQPNDLFTPLSGNTPLGKALIVEKNKDITDENAQIKFTTNYDPTLDLSRYKLPPIDLLDDHKSQNSEVTNDELISNKNKIVETLKNYKIEIQKIKATIGPTVTLYEIIPAPGVRISKIKSLEDDIALSLSALGIRIIAPMPGRGTVGIEVPNQKPEIVSMRSVISSKKFQECKFEIPIALGKTISNETYVVDLTKMPHLLVAGATGQGKSVGLNAILTSILYKKHPSQVKFVMVDPKKVELTLYEKIERHYLAKLPDSDEAIITDNQKVVNTLASLNIEMDNRYNLLKNAQVRNIKEYNEKFISRRLNPEHGHKFMPYIILIIDEFADLIMTAGKEVEMPIARLAQLSRAVGIHLIVATQRPSTNIITGVIKANFPTRLAFKVASMVDSRTILDSPGANQLIGRGDMLITQGSDLIRLQCAFIDTPEIDRITDFIGSQQGYPMAHILPDYVVEGGANDIESVDMSKRDDLFDDAARLVVVHQQGSTSLIQRKMSIGYNRAGRIMDQLEAAGIVGPFEGSKSRSVMYMDEYSLEQYLNSLNNK
jgi:S-DNA-T family DNA segregation ATPase FtsK/SpoIIIE